MRTTPLLFFFLLTINLFAQEKKDTASIKSYTRYSSILQEDRYIEVYAPFTAKSSTKQAYEVIYILDGAAHFTNVIDILKQLARETGDASFTQKIVVGIGNIWTRDRDYTPTTITSSPFVEEGAAKVSGGGEKFIAFLKKELIPFVDSLYPAGTNRVLIGHSLGGLIAVHILLHHTGLFNKYAAIDPSMWWDNQTLLHQSKKILVQKSFANNNLFLAIANTRNKDISDAVQLRKDTSRNTALNRPALLLADNVLAAGKNNLRFNWQYYKDFDHMSVFRPATYDALKFLLKTR